MQGIGGAAPKERAAPSGSEPEFVEQTPCWLFHKTRLYLDGESVVWRRRGFLFGDWIVLSVLPSDGTGTVPSAGAEPEKGTVAVPSPEKWGHIRKN